MDRDETSKLTNSSSSATRTSCKASRKCFEFFIWVFVIPPRGDMGEVMNSERQQDGDRMLDTIGLRGISGFGYFGEAINPGWLAARRFELIIQPGGDVITLL